MQINPAIFKSYDIRGAYPTELNEEMAYKIGQAYTKLFNPHQDEKHTGKVAVGMDVRTHSPQIREALIKGLTDAGVDVLDVGLISTEMIYFAVGYYHASGGIQVTASHNPAEFNGFKMVREDVVPISSDNGIFEMRDMILEGKEQIKGEKEGSVEKKDILDDFAYYLKDNFGEYWRQEDIKPLKVVINPNFGFEGEVIKYIVNKFNLPLTLIGLNDQPDGTFPKGRPDPFLPENRPEFLALVKKEQADLGVTWDADADRVFFAAPSGRFIDPYFMNALLIEEILENREKGQKIVYDPRYTWALIDAAKKHGATAVMERVGHSFIKARMRQENAIFSGESSGHTYFRDFFFADGGALPLMIVLEKISTSAKDLDQLLAPYFASYHISGEINSTVKDAKKILAELQNRYKDAEISLLDGLTIEYPDWRASIRSSNTEPLLRLNVEGKTPEVVERQRDELLSIIKAE